MTLEITSGKLNNQAQKVVVYGPEGIGKSTFAAQFPDAVFIDTEGSTKELDVRRLPVPSSWSYLLWEVDQVKQDPGICSTLIIDTADWAEKMCIEEMCSKHQVNGLEGFGYGKGYVYLAEEFGKLLNKLTDLVEIGINVVLTAHAIMRKFEQPDESGAYDRWELKLQKKTAPLLKEWADMVLFANYETYVVKEGEAKKAKARGGKRVMYTTHHPCWDAKNRKGFSEKMDFDFSNIASAIPVKSALEVQITVADPAPEVKEVQEETQTVLPDSDTALKKLYDLMGAHNVTRQQMQEIVADKGYFPADTPVENYPPDFIEGVLIAAWDQVHMAILNKEIPF
ncbi:MAG: ATP-binding protein [Anaerovoracaceae bacterium]